ncbi:MAG: hypothetical protein M3P12_14725 [Gemmatimonadota bacterium]|nr:hypothetical protein [Gemmatimonadota bacterium]
MRSSFIGATVAVTFAAVSTPALSQNTLAQRIARAPDGIVHVQFAARPGTCGDGRDVIGFRKALFAESFQSIGNWNSPNCRPGPVRVALSVANGKVTRVKTYVGGAWARTNERVTELGAVPSSEAAAYFFALIPQLEGSGRGGDKSRQLLPAVLADDPDALPRLISLARDNARVQETRRQAIQWIGLLGDAKVVPVLVSFARGGGAAPAGEDIDVDDEAPGKKGLATAAMAALSTLEDGSGVPALIDLARTGTSGTRGAAVFWLGQTADPRAYAALHGVIENAREDERIRAHAIFSLSHGGAPASEFAYLRQLYSRLTSDRLQESIIQGMGEEGSAGSTWLIDRARDGGESLKMRKSALFWAGQRKETPTNALVAYYRGTSDPTLREHTIFVLSQRQDEASLNELMRIAREDNDKRMRSRALFWLGQKDDPRVTKMIGDRVLR